MLPILNLLHYHQGAILTHLLALDDESRRLRFGEKLSDAKIVKYINRINWDFDGTYGIFNTNNELVGFAHATRNNNLIEFGVSVLPNYQKRGYGTQLFSKTALFARNHRHNKMFMRCLRENTAIIKIAQKRGMKLITNDKKIDAYLELPPYTPASLAEDYIQDSYGKFDSAVKQNIQRFNFFSKGISSLYYAYVNAFVTKTLKASAKNNDANLKIPKENKSQTTKYKNKSQSPKK